MASSVCAERRCLCGSVVAVVGPAPQRSIGVRSLETTVDKPPIIPSLSPRAQDLTLSAGLSRWYDAAQQNRIYRDRLA
jgi:hypothetical protein